MTFVVPTKIIKILWYFMILKLKLFIHIKVLNLKVIGFLLSWLLMWIWIFRENWIRISISVITNYSTLIILVHFNGIKEIWNSFTNRALNKPLYFVYYNDHSFSSFYSIAYSTNSIEVSLLQVPVLCYFHPVQI